MSLPSLSIAYWCVLAAAVLPYLCAWIAKLGSFGPKDNVSPRDWAAKQNGWRARANAAQANSFEGLPLFIGAVVIAHQLGAAQATVDRLAIAYVALRLVYIALYVRGANGARSAVWTLGVMVCVALVFAGR